MTSDPKEAGGACALRTPASKSLCGTLKDTGTAGPERAEMRPGRRASKSNRDTTLTPKAALLTLGLSSGAPDTHLEALPLLSLPSGLFAERRSLRPGTLPLDRLA